MASLFPSSRRRLAPATAAVVVATLLSLPAPARAASTAAGGLGPPNTWVPAGSMEVARSGQTATLLRDGKVLVAGGDTAGAELYNPATRTFSPTGRMPIVVTDATATLLRDGKVLVAGGLIRKTVFGQPVATAELYNPATGTWAATGSMTAARAGDTATLLPDGQVLVAGGRCNGHGYYSCTPGDYANPLSSAELYNPATGRWTRTGSMRARRAYDTATLLRDGKVLVAGGQAYCTDGVCVDTRSAELYNPATGTWAATGRMHQVREQFTATLLPDGDVLAAGGIDVSGNSGNSSMTRAELYNPATGTWRRTASMATQHVGQTATLLRNGWVLVAGGSNAAGASSNVAEIYEPRRAVWVLPGAMTTARSGQTATLLRDGHMLVTGGTGPDGNVLATAEEFLAGNGPLVSTTPGSIAFGGQLVGTTSGTHTYQVTNEGSADLVTSGVTPAGQHPADFRAATDCTKAPVVPGGTCTVSVRFRPAFTGPRTAAAALYDNAPGSPQTVALSGYGGGPDAWVPVGPMAAARDSFTATLLRNGKVLVAGGDGRGQLPPLASAELYNPATRSFSPTGSLHTGRSSAAAALLRNGQVLVAGGYGPAGGLASAELYNPATGAWRLSTPMHATGYDITATLLRTGSVLVTGLSSGQSAEVFDPASRTWTGTGPMTAPQFSGTATLLRDGEVLAAGGGTRAAELYNPATNRWTATSPLKVTQVSPAATALPDGEVLLAGGNGPGANGRALATSELYDPATGTWSLAKFMMSARRSGAAAALLPDGSVLEAGGCSSGYCDRGPALSSTELWARPDWLSNPPMTQPRADAVATVLPGGDVLVAGGDGTTSGVDQLSTAELYTPILMSMHPDRGPAGTRVTVSGTGFYAHEAVRVLWNYSKLTNRPRTTAAGTFTTTVTIPAASPGRYLVFAQGVRSAATMAEARATFTVTG